MSFPVLFRAGLRAASRGTHLRAATFPALRGVAKARCESVLPTSVVRISLRAQSTSSSPPVVYEGDEDDGPLKQQARRPPRWYQRPVFWFLGIVPLLTLGLGVWQVQRLQWKMDLIDELERKLKREPLSLPKNIDLEVLLQHYTNRLFVLPGHFPPSTSDNTLFLGPRVRDGKLGYHVVQALEREHGGGDVLVDRGFVLREMISNYQSDPSMWRLADTSTDAKTNSKDHLLLLPPPRRRNSFTPANDTTKNVWHFADIDELVSHFSGTAGAAESGTVEDDDSYTPSSGIAEGVQAMLGLQAKSKGRRRVLPVYMEEVFEGDVADASRFLSNGSPIGRAATVELRNQHAVYAATWFSLSAATSIMLAVLLRRAPRT